MELTKEDLKLEEEKLAFTIEEIQRQIAEFGEKIQSGDQSLKSFQRLHWENKQELDKGDKIAFSIENQERISKLNDQTKRVVNLNKIKDNPYFGSLIFNQESIYIGIQAVKKENDYLVYDWRAPLCSLFYEYGLGHVTYQAPGGEESGEITQKRQYKIEKAKLRHVFDTNLNIDDDLLQEVLAQTSSDKMKNIVNTIQVEQNEVIRDAITPNIVVQGIAGSGKTSVALHRIAFLLYKLEYLTSGNVLIFSPNQVFTEYISDVLPDLGEENTIQTTFHDFASSFLEEYTKVESYSSFVERYYRGVRQDNDLITFKLSDKIIEAMDAYVGYYSKAARFTNDLEFQGKSVSIDELNELIYERYNDKPLFERVKLIAEKINNRYYKGRDGDYTRILNRLYKIANFKSDYIEIYKNFFNSAIFKDYYPYLYRANENINGIEKKIIRYEDATPFIYMKCLLEGFPYKVAMREVVIDEAQDYTYLQYKIIKAIFKNANFTILGDVNQTVNPFYRYDTLKKIQELFPGDSKYIELNKTYRSSPEIIEYANQILGLSHISAIRRQANLPIIKKDLKDIHHIGRDIIYLKKKYKSVAIITKSIGEAQLLHDSLKSKYPKLSLINIDSATYSRDLVIAPAYGVKGLEFDAAIIINNFMDDRYLYYVAVTRSQHELIVYE